jgi:hypothetical protein
MINQLATTAVAAILLLASGPGMADGAPEQPMPAEIATPDELTIIQAPVLPTSEQILAKRHAELAKAREARKVAREERIYKLKRCGTPDQAKGTWCAQHHRAEEPEPPAPIALGAQ